MEASPTWTSDGARLVQADALALAEGLAAEGLAGKVDLVYVDPPFASERDYVSEARLDGPADGRVLRTRAYGDRWSAKDGGIGAYLEMLAPRLDALAGLLSPRGTLWVHLDWRAAYLVRVLLDEIFGRDGFVNEIVWRRAPNLGRQATSGQFGRTLDTLLVYGGPGAVIVPPTRLEPIEASAIRWDDAGRPFTTAPRGDYTDASIAKLEAEGRVHRTSSGRVYIKYFLVKDAQGTWCRERRIDALWTDVAPLRHAPPAERTGYPTQKPRSLLDRVVLAATPPSGLVVDAFAGSGSTGAAAHALGRRVILGDVSPLAIATSRARLLREGADVRVDRSARAGDARDAGDAGDPVPVRAALERAGDHGRELTVRLHTPAEPLAWAVGREQDGVFVRTWHAERAPGKRPIPASLEARLAAPSAKGAKGASAATASLVARVWTDDGRVGSAEVSR
jgi:DNA modification methylase